MQPTATDRSLAAALGTVPGIVAVAVGGSRATGTDDAASDTDLYAFSARGVPDAAARRAALGPLADGGDVLTESAWGPEDHLRVAGRPTEVIYVDLAGLGVDCFYDPGADPTGFTTAWLHTLATCAVLTDPTGALASVRDRLRTYPDATRARLLDQLPRELTTYVGLVRKAQARGDWTNVTDRRSALQAAWFDLLFAVNRRYHPGEKRLLTHAAPCSVLPSRTVERWTDAALLGADDARLPDLVGGLVDDLVALSGRSR